MSRAYLVISVYHGDGFVDQRNELFFDAQEAIERIKQFNDDDDTLVVKVYECVEITSTEKFSL